MGLRPLLGPPCIPPEAPRWGFPTSDIPRGLRGFCSGSFLAALGDLPARRAMPAGGIALDERAESVGLAVWSPITDGYCGERFVGVRIAAIKQGLSFESNFLCPAGTGLVLMLFWPPPAAIRSLPEKLH